MNIIKVEDPIGVVVPLGGQTAMLTKFLNDAGIQILGTSAEALILPRTESVLTHCWRPLISAVPQA